MDTSVFKQRATYKTFIALLDNYNAETGVQESASSAERREVQDFIAAVMQTKPMQYCHLYCRAKNPNMVPASQNDFADLLKTIWFELYRRSGQVDSSGFGTCLGLTKLLSLVFAHVTTNLHTTLGPFTVLFFRRRLSLSYSRAALECMCICIQHAREMSPQLGVLCQIVFTCYLPCLNA